MALDDVKQSVVSNITNAYEKALDKGATEPSNKNLENLASTIDSIQGGTVLGYHVRSVVSPDGSKQKIRIISGENLELQDKTITPTTEQQIVTADDDYFGLETITVEGVTANVDSNIVAENIKKDATILGVTGTFDNDVVDVTELPTENLEDNKLYRIRSGGGEYVYAWAGEEDQAIYLKYLLQYEEIFVNGIDTVTDPKVSSESTGKFYVYTDTQTYVGYVFLESADTRISLAEMWGHDFSWNRGKLDSLDNMTTSGVFYISSEETTLGVPLISTAKTVKEFYGNEWREYSRLNNEMLVGLWKANLQYEYAYIELLLDGTAILKDENGNTVGEGAYIVYPLDKWVRISFTNTQTNEQETLDADYEIQDDDVILMTYVQIQGVPGSLYYTKQSELVAGSGGSGGGYNVESVLNDDGTTQTLKITTASGGSSGDGGSSGGGDSVSYDGDYLCRVVDYDGKTLKEEWLNTGDVFTLPDIPTHDRFDFQEWASPVEIVNNEIIVDNYSLIISAVYTPKSGMSEFDIELLPAGGSLSFTLKMNGTKDWGDGTIDTNTSHTYADYGKYTVKCDGTTITASSTGGIFGQYSGSNTYPNYSVVAVYLGQNVTTIPAYAFHLCYVLHHVVIPKSVTSIGNNCFASSGAMRIITIPSSVQSLGSSLCTMAWGIKYAILSRGLMTIGTGLFSDVYGIEYIVFPDTITSTNYQNVFSYAYCLKGCAILGNASFNQTFAQCRNVEYIVCPSPTNVGIFGSYNCALRKLDFSKCKSIPTCSSGIFNSIYCNLLKIIVPDELYDTWLTTSNWGGYKKYIYKASEVR